MIEVRLLGLAPDVVGRVVAGQEDELNVGVGVVDLDQHLPVRSLFLHQPPTFSMPHHVFLWEISNIFPNFNDSYS